MRCIMVIALILWLNPNFVQAQQHSFPLGWTVDLRNAGYDPAPSLQNLSQLPLPAGINPELKKEVTALRKPHVSSRSKTQGTSVDPQVLRNFNGNSASGTPNDNHMAISNQGMVVSVVNSNVRIYDAKDGKELYAKGLGFFARPLTNLTRTYDPKVVWDPENQKFILVFLNGALSNFNDLVICFSQTSDPLGSWNCYKIPGNFESDTTWSDYPILAISKEDVFITLNKLKDNKGWKDGFVKSIIWQVSKKEGFKGDSLRSFYHHQNYLDNRAIWSICPVQGGEAPTHPFMHFLSVRPGDKSNDTVILHTIQGTVSSGNFTLTRKVLKTNRTYGLPPTAPQPGGQWLETNDARVLTGMYHNQIIQYAQTSVDTNNYHSGIYHGVIRNADGPNPSVTGEIISLDTADLAYPSIAHCGDGPFDHGAILTYSIVGENSYAGTACQYIDRTLNGKSDIKMVKEGIGMINVLSDTNERWGDYTGIQKKYNEKGVVWLCGSFGSTNGNHGTWIAEVKNSDIRLNTMNVREEMQIKLFPNPVQDSRFQIRLSSPSSKNEKGLFSLIAPDGKLLWNYTDIVKPGESQFSFDMNGLKSGIYVLKVGVGDRSFMEKVLVQ